MAILIINGTDEYELEAGEQDTVLTLLLTAQERFWEADRAIDKLVVNGKGIHPLDEVSLSKIPAAGATLEITLIDSGGREIDDTLGEARDYLVKLKNGFTQISEKIRNENDPESHKTLGQGINGLSTLLDLFNVLRDDEGFPTELNERFQEFLNELNEKTQELSDAQETQDPTLIADILEYEFVEVAEDLLGYLDEFEAVLRK